jgi:hypothetical protein
MRHPAMPAFAAQQQEHAHEQRRVQPIVSSPAVLA